jgi:hypothetical protein
MKDLLPSSATINGPMKLEFAHRPAFQENPKLVKDSGPVAFPTLFLMTIATSPYSAPTAGIALLFDVLHNMVSKHPIAVE